MSKFVKIASHTVPPLEKKTRLQDYPLGFFESITTKSSLKKVLKKKLVYLNKKQATTADFIQGGELLELYKDDQSTKTTIDLDLTVIYEDDYLAFINKPAGITVSGNKKWTLENALRSNLKPSLQKDALLHPEPIHRLDHPTSGILLIGKTTAAVITLNHLFEKKEIQKTYFAVTINKQEGKGIIDTPIDTKISSTKFEVKKSLVSERFDFLNLVELKPETGRKHQLRIHLASIGNPILGDKEYAVSEKTLFGNGLYLHAFSLEFTHPFTKETIFQSADLPKKFNRLFS
ncbi:RluA family pseudouridine synthase [Flavicella sediminum]|uniref:RluA family pseudouridine synthase n=1 Tax=Flavicella sediminum TaxID=2585141 RepID=UPI00112041C0|nr:RluA family pseudouridine synthase [Flavicella sediminum]